MSALPPPTFPKSGPPRSGWRRRLPIMGPNPARHLRAFPGAAQRPGLTSLTFGAILIGDAVRSRSSTGTCWAMHYSAALQDQRLRVGSTHIMAGNGSSTGVMRVLCTPHGGVRSSSAPVLHPHGPRGRLRLLQCAARGCCGSSAYHPAPSMMATRVRCIRSCRGATIVRSGSATVDHQPVSRCIPARGRHHFVSFLCGSAIRSGNRTLKPLLLRCTTCCRSADPGRGNAPKSGPGTSRPGPHNNPNGRCRQSSGNGRDRRSTRTLTVQGDTFSSCAFSSSLYLWGSCSTCRTTSATLTIRPGEPLG